MDTDVNAAEILDLTNLVLLKEVEKLRIGGLDVSGPNRKVTVRESWRWPPSVTVHYAPDGSNRDHNGHGVGSGGWNAHRHGSGYGNGNPYAHAHSSRPAPNVSARARTALHTANQFLTGESFEDAESDDFIADPLGFLTNRDAKPMGARRIRFLSNPNSKFQVLNRLQVPPRMMAPPGSPTQSPRSSTNQKKSTATHHVNWRPNESDVSSSDWVYADADAVDNDNDSDSEDEDDDNDNDDYGNDVNAMKSNSNLDLSQSQISVRSGDATSRQSDRSSKGRVSFRSDLVKNGSDGYNSASPLSARNASVLSTNRPALSSALSNRNSGSINEAASDVSSVGGSDADTRVLMPKLIVTTDNAGDYRLRYTNGNNSSRKINVHGEGDVSGDDSAAPTLTTSTATTSTSVFAATSSTSSMGDGFRKPVTRHVTSRTAGRNRAVLAGLVSEAEDDNGSGPRPMVPIFRTIEPKKLVAERPATPPAPEKIEPRRRPRRKQGLKTHPSWMDEDTFRNQNRIAYLRALNMARMKKLDRMEARLGSGAWEFLGQQLTTRTFSYYPLFRLRSGKKPNVYRPKRKSGNKFGRMYAVQSQAAEEEEPPKPRVIPPNVRVFGKIDVDSYLPPHPPPQQQQQQQKQQNKLVV